MGLRQFGAGLKPGHCEHGFLRVTTIRCLPLSICRELDVIEALRTTLWTRIVLIFVLGGIRMLCRVVVSRRRQVHDFTGDRPKFLRKPRTRNDVSSPCSVVNSNDPYRTSTVKGTSPKPTHRSYKQPQDREYLEDHSRATLIDIDSSHVL